MARRVSLTVIVLAVVAVQAGCATTTAPSRLQAYIGAFPTPGVDALMPLSSKTGRTGLLVIADQTADEAAPALPDAALIRLRDHLKDRLAQSLPLTVQTLLPPEGLQPQGDVRPWLELGKAHDMEYVLFVVASAAEQEYPQTVFLGWHSHSQPGLRRDNWSLLEAALIDVRTGAVLLREEGRSMATLDRPMAPGISQWYPVIWLRPAGPDGRPWWPPTYEGAPDTLRVVTMNDAANRMVLELQRAWVEFRRHVSAVFRQQSNGRGPGPVHQ